MALAVSQDEAALSAVVQASRAGLADALLFGDKEETSAILTKLGAEDTDLEIHHERDGLNAARAAVRSVRQGEADILLKGKIRTGPFLKIVLDASAGLRTGRLLSDVFIFEMTNQPETRLLMITDGGVSPAPNLDQKIQILRNAVEVAHSLGNQVPKVAVLSAVETVHSEMPSTIDAAILTMMNRRGQIKDCVVDGPLALDNAVSEAAAALKQLDSEVAGRADILLCPNIESANMLAKSTTYFSGYRLAHVIMGAAAPVLIPSRADSDDAKLLSIALGKLVIT